MIAFEDIDDVQEWLEPLGYAEFWEAVAPWGLFDPSDRAHFDRVLAEGVTDLETMLICLKVEARMALTERFGLKDRVYTPPDAKYLTAVH